MVANTIAKKIKADAKARMLETQIWIIHEHNKEDKIGQNGRRDRLVLSVKYLKRIILLII